MIIAYDVRDRQSFESVRYWIAQIQMVRRAKQNVNHYCCYADLSDL